MTRLAASTAPTAPDVLNEAGAGVYLGGPDAPIPPGTLRQWRFHGKGPAFVRVGRHVRYRRVDLDAYLAAGRVDPKDAR